MVYYDSPDQAKTYADKAFARMAELGLSPNPDNFTLWFTYVTGRDAVLNADVDRALNSELRFDDRRCFTMYQQYFGDQTESKLFTT